MARGMRWMSVALVLALLLPGSRLGGGPPGTPAPAPLPFFGESAQPLEASAPALLVEVYSHALRADEYVVVANPRDSPLDLSGWTITDGEGTIAFPTNVSVAAGERVVVAQNATAYWEDTLRPADFRYGAGNATPMSVTGSLRLNNDGDEVILRDPAGSTVDVFAYGASTFALDGWSGAAAKPVGLGHVARRDSDGDWRDTNTSADWDLVRVRSLGQSEHATARFNFGGRVRAAVTPDDGVGLLTSLLSGAESSIDACLYTFSSPEIGSAIVAAAKRGVKVRILLEGSPVGGISREEWDVLHNASSTVDFRFLTDSSTLDIQERYAFQHAKYAVLDNRTVVVSTENWGTSSFPPQDAAGSRGWLLAVEDAPLTAYFSRVFEEDFDARRRDVLTLEEMTFSPVPTPPFAMQPRAPRFAAREFRGTFRAVPVIGPDTTLSPDTILKAFAEAKQSIHVEAFYAHTAWGPFPNMYLDGLLAAARRGVEVRVLLDSSQFNVDEDDPIDNDDTVLYLNTIAANEDLDLQAKLVNLAAHGLTQLHTKGFVADGATVLVSSVNWNRNSPTANREAGILLENEGVAAYFEDVFAWDWKDDVTPPTADAGPDRAAVVGEGVAFRGFGSSDDAAVTNYSWDLDGDGAFDAWGAEVSHAYRQPGAVTVRLRVSDAWNNTAEDTSIVHVRHPPSPDNLPAALAVGAVGIASFLLVFFLVRRKRKGLSKSP